MKVRRFNHNYGNNLFNFLSSLSCLSLLDSLPSFVLKFPSPLHVLFPGEQAADFVLKLYHPTRNNVLTVISFVSAPFFPSRILGLYFLFVLRLRDEYLATDLAELNYKICIIPTFDSVYKLSWSTHRYRQNVSGITSPSNIKERVVRRIFGHEEEKITER
jgi:hypothetical protein